MTASLTKESRANAGLDVTTFRCTQGSTCKADSSGTSWPLRTPSSVPTNSGTAVASASGAEPATVRRPEELDRVEGQIIPGGESTTIWKLIDIFGPAEPLRKPIADGTTARGTSEEEGGDNAQGRQAHGSDHREPKPGKRVRRSGRRDAALLRRGGRGFITAHDAFAPGPDV